MHVGYLGDSLVYQGACVSPPTGALRRFGIWTLLYITRSFALLVLCSLVCSVPLLPHVIIFVSRLCWCTLWDLDLHNPCHSYPQLWSEPSRYEEREEDMAVPDNGPVIAGVTWFLCLFSGGFLALRLYAKISRKQGLWWDDHILIFAWVKSTIKSISFYPSLTSQS